MQLLQHRHPYQAATLLGLPQGAPALSPLRLSRQQQQQLLLPRLLPLPPAPRPPRPRRSACGLTSTACCCSRSTAATSSSPSSCRARRVGRTHNHTVCHVVRGPCPWVSPYPHCTQRLDTWQRPRIRVGQGAEQPRSLAFLDSSSGHSATRKALARSQSVAAIHCTRPHVPARNPADVTMPMSCAQQLRFVYACGLTWMLGASRTCVRVLTGARVCMT